MDCDKRHRLLMGPFGSGKSVGCVMEIVKRAAQQEANEAGIRKTRWAVVRNTNRQLEDTTIKTWLDWFPSPAWGKFRIADNNYDMRWILDDGSIVECEIRFRALDRPDQVTNLLSAEYTGAWFNEARSINKEIWEGMDGRIGRYPAVKDGGCTWRGILLDTNPPDEDSWIFDFFENECTDNAAAFYQPSGLSELAENVPHLDPGYYQNLKQGKDKFFIHVYVEGHYGYLRDGHPVYDEYVDEIHCVKGIEAVGNAPLYIGLDFGLTPAAVICQQMNGRLVVVDEVTATRAGIKQFLTVLRPYLSMNYKDCVVEEWYCDPAGNQKSQADMTSPFDVMIKEGIWPVEGEQNPDIRVESVKNLLNRMVDGVPAITISPRCQMLRKGFRGKYRFRRMKTSVEQYTDKPEKNDVSHIHDALQYLCTRMFGIWNDPSARVPRVIGGFR